MFPRYRYVLEILDENGTPLEQSAVEPDWQAALECTHLEAARHAGGLLVTAPAEGDVLPLWDAGLGEPHVGAFRVDVRLDGDATYSRELPISFLADLAREIAARHVESGLLNAGASVRYRVCAFATPPAPRGAAFDLAVDGVYEALPLAAGVLADLAPRRHPHRGIASDPAELPVLVDHRVVSEVTEHAAASPDIETGGLLIGHLHRDPERDDLFVEITAQLLARHTVASAAKLTFTAETWAATRDALALRRRGEILLGWWHTHPATCRECPAEQRRQCPLRVEFFSADDVQFQTTMFGRAFNVAMLVTLDIERPPALSMFGWRDGSVQQRGFDVIRADTHTHPRPGEMTQ